jgi:hypothetical protein
MDMSGTVTFGKSPTAAGKFTYSRGIPGARASSPTVEHKEPYARQYQWMLWDRPLLNATMYSRTQLLLGLVSRLAIRIGNRIINVIGSAGTKIRIL